MRSLKYLNVMLTVLCGLMVLQLWTTWMNPGAPGASLAMPAQAAPAAPAGGILDPGVQQKEIIDLLKTLVQKTEEQTELFKSGQARVRVEAAAEKPKG